MPRNRPARALAVLVLIVAQAAFALPHRTMVGQATAQAQAAGGDMAHTDCHHPGDGGNASHSKTPMPPCGNCPSSMPGPQGGGCPDMSSCGPSSASPSAPAQELLAVD